MQTTEYVAARNTDESERERLSLLEDISDPRTVARIDELGVRAGWRCLEVGAGGGSVTRWLAERVGPTGYVVATDIDPRFFDKLDASNVEVRRHDIVTDDIEENTFDIVHCRALLLHLPERKRALEQMYAAVRPGGWLLSRTSTRPRCTPPIPPNRRRPSSTASRRSRSVSSLRSEPSIRRTAAEFGR